MSRGLVRYSVALCATSALLGASKPATAAPEVCNGVDDDGDGLVDEPGAPPDGIDGTANPVDSTEHIGEACGSDVGACKKGAWSCVSGAFTCTGGVEPATEICDCFDNDCNGIVDDDPMVGDGGTAPICGANVACVAIAGVCECAKPCECGPKPCPTGPYECRFAPRSGQQAWADQRYCVELPNDLTCPLCSTDEYCDQLTGTCVPLPCDGGCPDGYECAAGDAGAYCASTCWRDTCIDAGGTFEAGACAHPGPPEPVPEGGSDAESEAREAGDDVDSGADVSVGSPARQQEPIYGLATGGGGCACALRQAPTGAPVKVLALALLGLAAHRRRRRGRGGSLAVRVGGVTCAVLIAVAGVACNSGDSALSQAVPPADAVTCSTLAHPPPPSAGAASTQDGKPVVLAMRRIRWSDVGANGQPDPNAWRSIGYDLDCMATSGSAPNHCTNTSVGPAWFDGDNGIDNSFGFNFFAQSGKDGFWQFHGWTETAIAAGETTKLFRLSGLGAGNDQASVAGAIFDAAPRATPPTWDGTDVWPVTADSVNGGDVTKPKLLAPGYVAEGTWVTGPLDSFAFPLIGCGAHATLVIHHALVTLKLAGDRRSADGIVAGVLDPKELAEPLGVAWHGQTCCTALSCWFPGWPYSAADVLLDGSQGGTRSCDGISIGIAFTAEAAELGSVVTLPADAGAE